MFINICLSFFISKLITSLKATINISILKSIYYIKQVETIMKKQIFNQSIPIALEQQGKIFQVLQSIRIAHHQPKWYLEIIFLILLIHK
jgi:hypothetical protein